MKRKLRASVIIFSLLSLTQFCIAESEIKEQKKELQNDKPKKLKVEDGATRIGEEDLTKPKERSIIMSHPDEKSKDSANLNVGKIEFYVK